MSAISMPIAFDTPADWAAIWSVWLSYGLVILTPGPNLLAVGGLSALHGFRACFPLILGIASGAVLQSLTVVIGMSLLAGHPSLTAGGRIIGAGLLLLIAIRLLKSALKPLPRPQDQSPQFFVKLVAGFSTGFSNPITFAGVTAAILGPASHIVGTVWGLVACAGIGTLAVLRNVLIAAAFSLPTARQFTLRWRQPACVLIAAAFCFLSVMMLRPILPSPEQGQALLAGAFGLQARASVNTAPASRPEDATVADAVMRALATSEEQHRNALETMTSALHRLEARVASLESALATRGMAAAEPPLALSLAHAPAKLPKETAAIQQSVDCDTFDDSSRPFLMLRFARGADNVSAEQSEAIRRIALPLASCAGFGLLISGHTDGNGADSTNKQLSRKRAVEVSHHFESLGIAPKRITVLARGSSHPLANNASSEGRDQNRRVEVWLKRI